MENHAQDNQPQKKKKKVTFLMTMSLKHSMTFKSFSTDLPVAEFVPKENTQQRTTEIVSI